MLKKLGKWYLYALGAFFAIAVIAALTGFKDPDAQFRRALKTQNVELMEKISHDNPGLIVDGKKATDILQPFEEAKAKAEAERLAKQKAEEERLAKEKAEKERIAKEKAEAERLAKQKAEKEKLAKEKAEKERAKPFKMHFETITKNVLRIDITDDDSAYMRNFKRQMNQKAKPVIVHYDYFISYKDSQLFISTKATTTKREINSERTIDINQIAHIIVSTLNKGDVEGGVTALNKVYTVTLSLFGNVPIPPDKKITMHFNDNKIMESFISELQKRIVLDKKKLLSESSKVTVHYSKNFTKKVYIKNDSILCENQQYLDLAVAYDRGASCFDISVDDVWERGNCLSSKNEHIRYGFIEKDVILKKGSMSAVLIKVKDYKDTKYLWIDSRYIKEI